MIATEKKKKQGRNAPCDCGSGKKYKKCCGGFASGTGTPPFDTRKAIQEAVAHHQAGHLERAEAVYLRVLSFENKNADALQLLGEIAYRRKDYVRAADLIQQAVHINPTSPVVYTNLGNALREIGEYEAAIDAFIHAIALKADALSAYENLADTIKKSNRLSEGPLRYLMKGLAEEGIRPEAKYGILVLLGDVIESPREWTGAIFERCILPATKAALDRGDYLFAYYLNALTAVSYAQQPHTAEQWRRVHAQTNPMYVSAGERLHQHLPKLVLSDDGAQGLRVAFLLDLSLGSGSGVALILNLLRGLSALRPKPFETIVYTLDSASPDLSDACLEIGVKLVELSKRCGDLASEVDFFQRLLALRACIQEDKVAALIYPGTYEAFPCFAVSIGLAPVQIYLSMGFRSLSIPSLDAYIVNGQPAAGTDLTRKGPSEKKWRPIPSSLKDPYPAEGSPAFFVLKQEVAALRREKFSRDSVILASIGRPQKIESVPFMNVLARILHANANAIFLWFGPEELSPVRQMMRERGISDRCLFQGWVDGKRYAQLIDIHLDSFPYAMGLSMHETMSAGTASVWMETREGEAVGISSDVQSLLLGESGTKADQEAAHALFRHPETGENLALLAHSEDEYVAYVQRLIDDEAFRIAVGAAGKHFMRQFMHDPRIAAAELSKHILEVIAECRLNRRAEIPFEDKAYP